MKVNALNIDDQCPPFRPGSVDVSMEFRETRQSLSFKRWFPSITLVVLS